jgi:transcriptional regulator with XRE-family HTH domain
VRSSSPPPPTPDTLDPQILGHRIAQLRGARGWKQRELARRAAIQYHQLSRIERGHRFPSLLELVGLRSALEVDLEGIVFGLPPSSLPDEASSIAVVSPEDLASLQRLVDRLRTGSSPAPPGEHPARTALVESGAGDR